MCSNRLGGLFRLRDHREDAAIPDPPAAAQELEEEELVACASLLCSVLPMVAWLGRAQATTSLTSAREEVLRSKLVWDSDIVSQVTNCCCKVKGAALWSASGEAHGAEPTAQG